MPGAGSDGLGDWEGSSKGRSEWIVPWEERGDEMRESQGQSLWNPSINPPQKRPLKGRQSRSENQKARFKDKEWSGLRANKKESSKAGLDNLELTSLEQQGVEE